MSDHYVDALRYYLTAMGVKRVPWYKVYWIKIKRFVRRTWNHFRANLLSVVGGE